MTALLISYGLILLAVLFRARLVDGLASIYFDFLCLGILGNEASDCTSVGGSSSYFDVVNESVARAKSYRCGVFSRSILTINGRTT